MPKQKTSKASKAKGLEAEGAKLSKLNFPTISPKEDLEIDVVLPDQILIIEDFLSPLECKEFIKFIDKQCPMTLTPPPKAGEATRVNSRFSIASSEFADALHGLLSPHLPAFPAPSWIRSGQPRKADGCNSNIRIYKYTPNQYFGCHYDDSVRDPETGTRSEWTLLIYLSGVEDGVEGGETIFYKDDQRGKPRESIVPRLVRGSALLHRHGAECMAHEGSRVLAGTKYVLRSDLMFLR